ncbi:MAG: galactose mutarotase, partial [Rhodospirillales bacterium]|nr:galactose mutarotase [Acetobacter sp.]
PYLEDTYFLGCTVGRYANRIAKGRFSLGGKTYQLDRNNDGNTLHGGSHGLWNLNWNSRILADGVEFSLRSPAGDQGFPGTLSVTARYRLADDEIRLEYEASTDETTVVNLTNHAYFNLAGEGTPSILDHQLQILADAVTPIAEDAIPLGENQAVAGSPFDFTTPHAIGDRIHEAHPQLLNGRGYDHNFVLRGPEGEVRKAAVAVDPHSGRRLEVSTTEPGVQFYSGNYLAGTTRGRAGNPYGFRSAFCLETQHFPDSPNRPEFPSTVLPAAKPFRSTTVWKLGAGER